MSITYTQAANVLDREFGGVGYTAEATYYMGLSTTAYNNDGTGGTEPSDVNYARVAITNTKSTPSTWSTAASGALTNVASVTFPESLLAWGTIIAIGFYDAASSGNLLYFEAITPKVVAAVTTTFFAAGDIDIAMNTSSIAYVQSNKVLDYEFGAVTYVAQTNYYVGLSTTPVSVDGTGATEVSGGSYARVTIANNKTTFSTPTASGAVSNSIAIEFPESTLSWGTVTDVVFYSTLGGNVVLYSEALDDNRLVATATTVTFAIGGLDILMDNS